MKKGFCALLAALALVGLLAGCSRSAVQQATGANAQQGSAIEEVLAECGIDYETIAPVTAEQLREELDGDVMEDEDYETLAQYMKMYDVTDRAGRAYRMTLNADNLEVAAVVALDTGEFLYGNLGALVGDAGKYGLD